MESENKQKGWWLEIISEGFYINLKVVKFTTTTGVTISTMIQELIPELSKEMPTQPNKHKKQVIETNQNKQR